MEGSATYEFKDILNFLNKLEQNNIYYTLNKVRNKAIMVEVVVPGQRWEIEFTKDGSVDIEKFISDGDFYGENEIDALLKEFAD